jgi:HTH-type transcriptional regulator/antitoxin HigA
MEIRSIRTEEDHVAALREIEFLWGAETGSPEGDALEVLATLVEQYEEERFPLLA